MMFSRMYFILIILLFTQMSFAAVWGEDNWGFSLWGFFDESIPLPLFALIVLPVVLFLLGKKASRNNFKQILLPAVLLILIVSPQGGVNAQVQVPHVFSNGSVIDADEMNENFDTLETAIENGLVGPQGPQGETGPQGAQGPEGPAGPVTTSFAVCFKRIGNNISPSSLECGCSNQLSRQEAFAGGSCRATSDVGTCSENTSGSDPQVALCCVCAQ